MLKVLALLFITIPFPFFFSLSLSAQSIPPISDSTALLIGNKIWKNECNGTIRGLTSWNEGENFASLGIAHFIWYPASEPKVFEESFPHLLDFLAQNRVTLPFWLKNHPACPWATRDEFLKAVINPQDEKMIELKQLLQLTISLQARFTIIRLQKAFPLILEKTEPKDRPHLTQNFNALARIPAGLFDLVDYVNFKGEGIKETERYKNQGWGLLQVLLQMPPSDGSGALFQFSQAAEFILTLRVKNAPPERREERWLPGWLNRVRAYQNYNLD